jgi:diaminopimelate decarboxylase/aspartate kinase
VKLAAETAEQETGCHHPTRKDYPRGFFFGRRNVQRKRQEMVHSNSIAEAAFTDGESQGLQQQFGLSPWVVMKFGGSSVSTVANWRTIAALLSNRLSSELRPFVVLSALQGVSNRLERIVSRAAGGDPTAELNLLRDQHVELADALGLADKDFLNDGFRELEKAVQRIREQGAVSPKLQAAVLCTGELLASAIGVAYLRQQGMKALWIDAREVLRSDNRMQRSPTQKYLSATCEHDADSVLQHRLQDCGAIILTQGFIARDSAGDTILLGREGSDTSAAYFAAMLQARRLEIWKDVPGMFSADPRLVPSARLLVDLHYDEARELASTGSTVLHPRCLSPLSRSGIPLYIRCLAAPAMPGTVVSAAPRDSVPQVKGISARKGVTLVSMDGMAMWHEVGFLADAFAVFARHGVSVDLVSTSESNVTVSVDTIDGMFPEAVQDALVGDLQNLCRVRMIPNCAVVSLVGRRIRSNLARMSPALAVFEEEKIHLVSQGASDLNFSFVIDEDQVSRLLAKLHSTMIRGAATGTVFGPSWEQLFEAPVKQHPAQPAWWISRRDELLQIAEQRGSAYVYDSDSIRRAAAGVLALASVSRVLYAVKANFNADVIRLLAAAGIDFDCVSPGEVQHLFSLIPDLDRKRILYTPNFAPREEYAWALDEGLQLTLDSLYPLQAWPELFGGSRLFIRLDPGKGHGHHDHVRTAGIHSKFGVPIFEVDELVELLEKANAVVIGVHAHSGSGIHDPDNWLSVAEKLVQVAKRFPQAHILDLGGGIGVPEKTGDVAFDLAVLDRLLQQFKQRHPDYELWLEPGRYLVSQAGVLLSRVTQTKGKAEMRYVGIGTGMNSLIRPALYGAYHEIVNLTRLHEPAVETVTIVGPICESGDKLGSDRLLPHTVEDDVLLIGNAGAYGYAMSSRYNLREPAGELVI